MLKKIIMVSGIFLLSQNLFGVDISKDFTKEKSLKNDTAISTKKSKNKTESSKTATTSKSSIDKTANVEIDFYQYLISNPKVNDCIFFEKTLTDFGVTSFQDGDYIDVSLQNFYEQISKNNADVSKADMDVEKFKSYLKCIGKESATFAQAIVNFGSKLNRQENISANELRGRIIKDYENSKDNLDGNIEIIFSNFERSLEKNNCVFAGEMQKIKCGGVVFSFADNSLKFGDQVLSGTDKFYGVTGKTTVAINTTSDRVVENSNETQTAKNQETSLTKTKSASKNLQDKKSISTGKFIPAP